MLNSHPYLYRIDRISYQLYFQRMMRLNQHIFDDIFDIETCSLILLDCTL